MPEYEDWHWQAEHDASAWDRELARLGGHPLQSALWGEARRLAEGVEYRCFAARKGDTVVGLARVETRRLPLIGRVAWLPKGPVCKDRKGILSLQEALRRERYILGILDPWQEVGVGASDSLAVSRPRTIWLDLTLGKEQLWRNLDSQWRYGVRRAQREGVVVGQSKDKSEIALFYKLCEDISKTKRFKLPGSLSLMQTLFDLSVPNAPVEAQLFTAKYDDQLIAGVFILRSGAHVHYIWGGVDRRYPKLRAGEAVQWAVIEWALSAGCKTYDLEGIDPVNNPGTYQFKRKMGGREVTLSGMEFIPLSWSGKLVVNVGRRLGKISADAGL